ARRIRAPRALRAPRWPSGPSPARWRARALPRTAGDRPPRARGSGIGATLALAVCWHLLGALVEEAKGARVPLNHGPVGRRCQQASVLVTRQHVGRVGEALGGRSAVFRDPGAARAAGYLDQVAPPTFVTVMQIMASAQVVLDQELGLDYSRVVHGEQEYEWRRPVVVGDVLSATPEIASISARGPNEFLVIESDIHDPSRDTLLAPPSPLLS